MKLITLVLVFISSAVFAAEECTAPESVKKLAGLLEKTFDGSTIKCDDGNEFSSKLQFECRGSKYYGIKDAADLTTTKEGAKKYIVTVLSEDKGKVQLTEETYPDKEAFDSVAKPEKVLVTSFLQLSERSLSFYSTQPPSGKSWMLALWFIPEGEEKARGYKLFTDHSTECK